MNGGGSLILKNTVNGGNIDGYLDFSKQRQQFDNLLGDINNQSSTVKGNWAEMGADVDAVAKGYEPLHKPITDMNSGHNGIDHVFRKDGKYYIVETKYKGSANLSPANPETGLARQMSDDWIKGVDPDDISGSRLEQALGRELANQVNKEGYQRLIANVAPDGSITHKLIDADGYIVRGNAGIFDF